MLKKFHLAAALLTIFAVAGGAPAPGKYSADASHSTVGFSVPILNGISRVRGKFSSFSVSIDYDEADIAKSAVRATVKAASIDTGIDARDKHLRSADFFDVEKYPETTFQSKRVAKKGKKLVATGDFTMHGVTKEITVPFTITGKFINDTNNQTMVGFLANLTVDRRDFGMLWKRSSIPNFVGDIVDIDLSILVRTEPTK